MYQILILPTMLLATTVAPPMSGCSHLHLGMGRKVSVEAAETITLDVGNSNLVRVKTYNGNVAITGSDASDHRITIQVKKVARAHTAEEAEACMEAIRIVTDQSDGVQHVTAKRPEPSSSGCDAIVSFAINMPAALGVHVTTHNGPVEITGIQGDCRANTHNGGITVDTTSRSLAVSTHNGRIRAAAMAQEVNASTHNGGIHLELNGPHNVTGTVRTHNGAVALVMNRDAAANFDCGTHNGRIRSELDLSDVSRQRRGMKGRFGDASGRLRITTHNGAISIR